MDPLSPAVLACNDRTRLSPPDRNAAALPVPPGGARVQRPNRGRRLERMLRQRARDVLPVGPAARTGRPTSDVDRSAGRCRPPRQRRLPPRRWGLRGRDRDAWPCRPRPSRGTTPRAILIRSHVARGQRP